MNDTNLNPMGMDSHADQTDGGVNMGKSGYCQKMMAACKDMCTRFLDTRISVNYSITTDITGAADKCMQKTTEGDSHSTGNAAPAQSGSKNSMMKEGTLEVRALDLAAGAVLMWTLLSVMAMLKGVCRRK